VFARPAGAWAGDQNGATAAEFALVLPIFLVATMAVVEFGWAQHKLSSIRFVMESAARGVMLDQTLSQQQVADMVRAQLATIGDPNVTVTLVKAQTAGGQVATLTGSYLGEIGIPGLMAMPIHWSTQVSTALPAT
jgi:Flp pilus assembly protein TadG